MPDNESSEALPVPDQDPATVIGISADRLSGAKVTIVVDGADEQPNVKLEVELESGRKQTVPVPEAFVDTAKKTIRVAALARWLGLDECPLVDALANADSERAEYVSKPQLAESFGVAETARVSEVPVSLHRSRRGAWSLRLNPLWSGLHRLSLGSFAAEAISKPIGAATGTPAPATPKPGTATPGNEIPRWNDPEKGPFRSRLARYGRFWKPLAGAVGVGAAGIAIYAAASSGGDSGVDDSQAQDVPAAGQVADAEAVSDLASAVERFVDGGMGTFDFTIAISDGPGAELTIGGQGEYDTATETARFTYDVSPFLSPEAPLPEGIEPTVEVVVTPDSYYFRSPIFATFAPDTDWVEAEPDAFVGDNRLDAVGLGFVSLGTAVSPLGSVYELADATVTGFTDEERRVPFESAVDELGDLPRFRHIRNGYVGVFGAPYENLIDLRIPGTVVLRDDGTIDSLLKEIQFELAIGALSDVNPDAERLRNRTVDVSLDYGDPGVDLESLFGPPTGAAPYDAWVLVAIEALGR